MNVTSLAYRQRSIFRVGLLNIVF